MNPECPQCESSSTRRRPRTHSLSDRLMYFFGLFPWECVDCQWRFFSARRYSRKERHPAGEVYIGGKKSPAVKPGSEERTSQS